MAKPTFQQFSEAIMGAVPFNLSAELYQQWIDNPKVLTQVLQQALGAFPKPISPAFPSYSVTVNYNQTVEQLIKAGNYFEVSSDITDKHFHVDKQGEEQIEIFVVSIDRPMSDIQVTQLFDSLGLRDANIKEELSLSTQYPDLQRKGLIFARGTTWRETAADLYVTCLNCNGLHRSLHLGWLSCIWPSSWRFAAVRK